MEDLADKKVALITDITRQDGAYLASFLLDNWYIVHAIKLHDSMIITRSSGYHYQDSFVDNPDFILHNGDITDTTIMYRLLQEIQPDEIYSLASQSHINIGFNMIEPTHKVDGIGVLSILCAVRGLQLESKTRIYQGSSTALYNKAFSLGKVYDEARFFYPQIPYAVAKLYPFWVIKNYREAYNMYVCNGITFNKENPLAEEPFVAGMITQEVVKIALGLQSRIQVSDLAAEYDWVHAKDYVEVIWLILQQDKADDYIIATGVTTTLREFVRMCFEELGIEILFSGKGEQEKGVIVDRDEARLKELGINSDLIKMGQTVLKVDAQYYSPKGLDILGGNVKKAVEYLKWKPKYDLQMLVSEMVLHDLKTMQGEQSCDNLVL